MNTKDQILDDLEVVCAWCGKVLKEGNPEHTSHGICERCLKTQIDELDKEYD